MNGLGKLLSCVPRSFNKEKTVLEGVVEGVNALGANPRNLRNRFQIRVRFLQIVPIEGWAGRDGVEARQAADSDADATRADSASTAAPTKMLSSAAVNRGECAAVRSPPSSRAPMRMKHPGMRSR